MEFYQNDSQYSRNLIEASVDPLVTLNPEGKITDMNRAFTHLMGKNRIDLTYTDFKTYFCEPEKAETLFKEVFDKKTVTNFPLVLENSKTTDLLFNGSVFLDQQYNIVGAVLVGRDISELKRVQNELIEAKLLAETIAKETEKAKQKAEEATKAKQQFLSNMSHEIRTPMNAIIGFTKVMLRTEISSKQREYLSAIKMSGDALVVLINDILDLAKVEAGKMNFERQPFKLASCISAILQLFENKIQEKKLELIAYYDEEIPEVLLGDPTRLHQIMSNLISNAVKFTEKGSIQVSVKLLEQDQSNALVVFTVSDTGIGIAENKKEKIFENFQQATVETARMYGGTGLGLAIVKQLVEAQGGQIEVNSIPGVGSTFSFVLSFPKTSKKVREETEMPIAISETDKAKVLVAEDMKMNQLLMKTLIEEFGFSCTVVENGRCAVEKLATEPFDIVLMDLQMPEMGGFEATEHIRNEMNSDIPIIALTADVTTTDLEKCKMVGMDDYISKPIDDRLLFNSIVNQLKNHKSLTKEAAETKKETNLKCVDMSHLNKLTKSNENFLSQMILAYLEQTPFLINTIKSSFENKEWDTLCAAVHKLIPSFSLIGMKGPYENTARKIHEFAHQQQLSQEIHCSILELEKACVETCKELETELSTLNCEINET